MKYLKVFALLTILIMFSCNENDESASLKINKKISSKKNTKQKIEKIEDVAPVKEAALFFNGYGEVKAAPVIIQKVIAGVKPAVNQGDYKVIVDWKIGEQRYLKLKNMKTGVENVIKDGDTSGNIILIERTLMSYKLKIEGQIVEVKR
jgi:hypothetical protein